MHQPSQDRQHFGEFFRLIGSSREVVPNGGPHRLEVHRGHARSEQLSQQREPVMVLVLAAAEYDRNARGRVEEVPRHYPLQVFLNERWDGELWCYVFDMSLWVIPEAILYMWVYLM